MGPKFTDRLGCARNALCRARTGGGPAEIKFNEERTISAESAWPGASVALAPRRAPHRRRQRRPDDRARHQHLPAGRSRGRGARSRARRSRTHLRNILAAGRHAHSLDHRDAHAPRSFAAGRRARARDGCAPDRLAAARRRPARRELSARSICRATANGSRSAISSLTAIHTPGHASNCVCYLLRRRAAAVHRRSRARRSLTGHPAARRRHGGVPALSREARRLRFRAHCAGSRRAHGATARQVARAVARSPPGARGKVLRCLAAARRHARRSMS